MKEKTFLKIIIFASLVGIATGLVFSLLAFKKPADNLVLSAQASPVVETTPSPTPKVPQIQYAEPAFIVIPNLSINTRVESVGTDAEGKMDVPQDDRNVGWYNLGYKPGEKGSAVMAGHLDTAAGAPAVFYNLSSLVAGDEVSVVDKDGRNLVFTVTRIQNYPFDQVPLQEIFGVNDKPRLNLITCTGIWNIGSRNYSNRLVVYTELKE